MTVKPKEYFEKTRHIKKTTNLKSLYCEDKEIQDIIKKYYQIKKKFQFSLRI